ncbi:hypothetical protein TcWFU_006798 [Taenia crassiceps]|uniref:Uncharacterized protein n=1 Tax=Taenia crassiceps TaxID=6207 RepID=A0ABR4Q8C2_9CEST
MLSLPEASFMPLTEKWRPFDEVGQCRAGNAAAERGMHLQGRDTSRLDSSPPLSSPLVSSPLLASPLLSSRLVSSRLVSTNACKTCIGRAVLEAFSGA